MTLPLLLLLLIPILFGARSLYPWARSELVQADPILQHQSSLLNVGTAGGITIGIFLIWSIFAFWIVGWGLRYDRTDDLPDVSIGVNKNLSYPLDKLRGRLVRNKSLAELLRYEARS